MQRVWIKIWISSIDKILLRVFCLILWSNIKIENSSTFLDQMYDKLYVSEKIISTLVNRVCIILVQIYLLDWSIHVTLSVEWYGARMLRSCTVLLHVFLHCSLISLLVLFSYHSSLSYISHRTFLHSYMLSSITSQSVA